MATRGLWASLAALIVLVSHPAMGQWMGRTVEDYRAGYVRPEVVNQETSSRVSSLDPGYQGIWQAAYQVEAGPAPAPMPRETAPVPPVPSEVPPVDPHAPPPPPGLGSDPYAPPAPVGPGVPAPGEAPPPPDGGRWGWLGSAPGFGPENSPCAADGGGYCCPPSWSFEQGVRILTRSRTRRGYVSYELLTAPPYQSEPVTTKALSFDVAAGYYATIARYLGRDTSNRDHFIEFGYWGMNTWDASKTQGGAVLPLEQDSGYARYGGSLMSYFNPDDHVASFEETVISNGFNNALHHRLYYTSDIHNFEINLRLHPRGRPDRLVLYPNGRWRRERQPGQYCTWLAGLRGMSIDEVFEFSSRGHTVEYFDTNEDGALDSQLRTEHSGLYHIRTHNDMFGFQIGGELTFRDRLWEFGGRFKLGPMINFADQVTEITGFQRDWRDLKASVYRKEHKYEVAGMAEVGVEGTYKITPHLTFHAAYDWLFLTNLALAPEQLDYDIAPDLAGYDNSKVNVNGHALYHGLTLGLEWLW